MSHRAVLPGLELSSSYCKGRGSRPDGRDVMFHLQPFPGPWSEVPGAKQASFFGLRLST